MNGCGMSGWRIGLYGGTFDPPHIGHVRAARKFIQAAQLNCLYIMPTNVPPHKHIDHTDNPKLRLGMCREAFGGIDGVTVSDYEICKKGVSYTVDTLRHLSEVAGGAELFMLCGDDMFLSLDRWREPEEIFRLAHIYCMRRYEYGDVQIEERRRYYEDRFGANVSIIDSPPYPVSSTEIRRLVSCGGDISGAVPHQVAEFIMSHGLYRD